MTKTIKLRPSLLLSCMFGVLFLAACSTANVGGNVAEITETATEAAPTATTRLALTLPTETPEEVNECVACHSDKQRLIDTAKPEEEVVSENEGAG